MWTFSHTVTSCKGEVHKRAVNTPSPFQKKQNGYYFIRQIAQLISQGMMQNDRKSLEVMTQIMGSSYTPIFFHCFFLPSSFTSKTNLSMSSFNNYQMQNTNGMVSKSSHLTPVIYLEND